jgi:glycerol-3-phosphate dehydrogenase
MRSIHTDILVIGGGATGTGVLRDLAMRGIKCLLVERRDLAYGTTGRYHGLLHSGARYVVKDPHAARECFEENSILRKIMPQCIDDTGGYFVLTPHDDPAYIPHFLTGCHQAGITVDDIPIHQMLDQEPLLNPEIHACFRVPDASADSFLAANQTAESAREYGAQVLTYHEVDHLIVTPNASSGQPTVVGAVCHDVVKDEDIQIDAFLVVNASGAWAGKIAQTAGIEIVMVPGKGTMLALNHRVVNTVINRCRPPSDGDILVPSHTVAVMGTTDIRVADPDHFSIEPWEISLMLDEGEKIIPSFKQFRILRAWAGVRPLVQGAGSSGDREISRSFVLIDHADRDGVEGMLTISGGKWTTFRKMAQVTVDRVCDKLKIDRPCTTHLERLPTHHTKYTAYSYQGERLKNIEGSASYGELICECELVTRQEVEQAIITSNAVTLDDIRRETRLGMGPCQGAFCAFRTAGLLQTLRQPDVYQTNQSLRDFLEERWKGNLPILSSQQLHQARFSELIYVNVLNTASLPGEPHSRLAADEYTVAAPDNSIRPTSNYSPLIKTAPSNLPTQDVLVIGAGFPGLFTAWHVGLTGSKVSVLTRGWGAPYWSSGCIDVLGYQSPDYSQRVTSPRESLEHLLNSAPEHPYALAGIPAIENAIQSLQELCKASNYPMHGSLDKNILIPTSLGTLRPTCLVPASMVSGDASLRTPMLIVGFDRFYDFYPSVISANLNALDILSGELSLDLPSLLRRKFVNGMVLARLFDGPEFRQEVIDAVKPRLGKFDRIGFPAVLGLNNAAEVLEHLQSGLGVPVFEIPGLPPSIPGIRLQNILVATIQKCQGSVFTGMHVTKSGTDGKVINSIWSESPARQIPHRAKNYVLATGGILGGGITIDNGYAQESIFGLPVATPDDPALWFNKNFLEHGQLLFRSGIRTDDEFRPIDDSDRVIYSNLHVVGGALADCDPIRERSLDGIALVSGTKVAEIITARSSR